jgi:hypothetical protein
LSLLLTKPLLEQQKQWEGYIHEGMTHPLFQVRQIALKVINIFGHQFISHLLPSIKKVIYDENPRCRIAAIELLSNYVITQKTYVIDLTASPPSPSCAKIFDCYDKILRAAKTPEG